MAGRARRRSRARASSSTWATATAGRASTATASTRRSQNGFGLNPTAGGNDYSHQYFGEGPIADDVRLAKNAVVLLNHLCYASGNTEPGLAEGTPAQARQRVDNFAAGFIKAGAAAVIAEAYGSPNNMVKVVLGGKRSIEAAWRGAPTRERQPRSPSRALAARATSPRWIPSAATPGSRARSCSRAGLAASDVLRGARGSAHALRRPRRSTPSALVPSLAGTGVELAAPVIQGSTASAGKLRYKIPFTIADREKLPASLQASARWDLLEPVAADPGAEVDAPEPTTGAAVPADRRARLRADQRRAPGRRHRARRPSRSRRPRWRSMLRRRRSRAATG